RTATISLASTTRFTPRSTSVSPYLVCRSLMASKGLMAMRCSELCRRAMAEIGLDYDGIRNDLRRRALGDDPAFGEDEHMFGEAHHRLHDVLDHQDGNAASAQIADNWNDISDLRRVEPGQNLVQQQQLGIGCERPRKLEPLAPGDGQRVGRPVKEIAQPYL